MHQFVSSGSGQGQCVKNNTASVWNRTGKSVFVFYNSDFGGVYDEVAQRRPGRPQRQRQEQQRLADRRRRVAALPAQRHQADIKNRTPHWCWDSKVNCHHDYNASDIFAATGTSVLSPVNGTVMTRNVRAGSTGCDSVGSTVTVKDGFGRLWYFAHMDDSPAPVVSVGQSVTKGQRLGYVGTKYHALCTDSHLHIDMRVGVDSRVSCSAAACAGYGFVNDQPLLRNAFLALP